MLHDEKYTLLLLLYPGNHITILGIPTTGDCFIAFWAEKLKLTLFDYELMYIFTWQ